MTDVPDLRDFQSIVFFTGAGLSVESGIPTYRGRDGVWQRYDYRRIACQEAFERDPELVWEYHESRREKIGAVRPNAGHEVIAAVERERPTTRIVTQNIDGLHQRAGSRSVTELHGSVWRVRCAREGDSREDLRIPLPTHHCDCGAWLRPDIVWFGDALDPACLQAAADAITNCDLLVSVGTSGVVYPAADLPLLARGGGATCVEVNPEETPLSGAYDVHLRMPAS
ncbi:MAG: SIR2 family NAD-dependent protein deacylase, partial [Planctomycetota bacterium]